MLKLGRYVMTAGLIALILFLVLTSPNNDKSIDALSGEILGDEGAGTMEPKGRSELKHYYGIGRDDVEGFVLYGPANSADVSEWLLVKAYEKDDLTEIRKSVERRLAERKAAFKEAGGVQYQLLEKAELKVRGRFLFYCVGENAAAYGDAFVRFVRK